MLDRARFRARPLIGSRADRGERRRRVRALRRCTRHMTGDHRRAASPGRRRRCAAARSVAAAISPNRVSASPRPATPPRRVPSSRASPSISSIVDVMMPGESGLALTESLRQTKPHVPILLLTAMAEPDDRIDGLGARRRRLSHQAVRAARTGAAHPQYPAARSRPRRSVVRQSCRSAPIASISKRSALYRGEEPVHLTAAETALLVALARKPGEPVSREALVARGAVQRQSPHRRCADDAAAAQDRARSEIPALSPDRARNGLCPQARLSRRATPAPAASRPTPRSRERSAASSATDSASPLVQARAAALALGPLAAHHRDAADPARRCSRPGSSTTGVWDTVARRLSTAVAGEIGFTLELAEQPPIRASAHADFWSRDRRC